jgi:hypothetical protein
MLLFSTTDETSGNAFCLFSLAQIMYSV